QPLVERTARAQQRHPRPALAALARARGGARVDRRRRVFFPPGAFGQSHLDLADSMVRRVHDWVPTGARVVELYAGCRPIGLGLVRRAAMLVLNESAPDALRGLALGLAARPEEERARARVAAGGAGELSPALLSGAEVAIVDPPRKGLDSAVLDALCAEPPGR